MENIKTFFKKHNIDFFYPIAFILTIVPLIVRYVPITPDDNTLSIWGPKNASSDMFSQTKALLLLIFCIILVIISVAFFKKIFEKKDKVINYILISTAVFFIFTLLSSVFSQYKDVAFHGVYDRAEGFITITCYLVVFVYSLYTFKSTKNYKRVLTPILIVVSINAFLGLFQYVGQDLIQTKLGQLITIPSDLQDPNRGMTLLYGAGKLYGTLFHYDYVGSFVAIVLPILFCLTLFEYEDILYKISLGLGTLFSIWLLFGSSSRAGIVGLLFSIIFGVIVFWKLLLPKRKPLLIILALFVVIIVGLNFATKGKIFERVPTLVHDAESILRNTSNVNYRDSSYLKDIKTTDTGVEVILQTDTMKISYENNNFVFKDSKDKIINYTLNKNVLTTADERFKKISVNIAKFYANSTRNDSLIVSFDNKPSFPLLLKKDNTLHLINPYNGKDINVEYPETFGYFNGKEKLGSARGYIWGRTIPLLKNNLILGGGPDTFAFRFPQNDLVGKYYAYDTSTVAVDKPHNMYLQIATNQGIIALLAFLAIVIIYIVDSMKLYALKKDYTKSQALGASICLGVIGYLFAAFFNDSIVSVAPVFWIILGVGVALNYTNRNEPIKKLK